VGQPLSQRSTSEPEAVKSVGSADDAEPEVPPAGAGLPPPLDAPAELSPVVTVRKSAEKVPACAPSAR
jgi:hypothetical protein